MDVDLTQDCVSRINEAMRRVGGNYHDAAGLHFARFVADRDGGAAFERERHLDVWMRVQWRTLAGFRVDDVG